MNGLRLSRLLSLVLRHEPQRLGLTLDHAGWVDVDALLAVCAHEGIPLTREPGAFRSGRARLTSQEPPELLYHGTVAKFLPSIHAQGLLKGGASSRALVRRPRDCYEGWRATWGTGNSRRALRHDASGRPRVFLSANGVWLVDAVPPEFIRE